MFHQRNIDIHNHVHLYIEKLKRSMYCCTREMCCYVLGKLGARAYVCGWHALFIMYW